MKLRGLTTCCCRNRGQEDVSAERIAELERQLAGAKPGTESDVNDESSRTVRILAEVSLVAHCLCLPDKASCLISQ